MKTFQEFVNESNFPEFLKNSEFFNKTYDLNGRIPQEIAKLKVIEKGYSKIAKMLSWSLNSGNGRLTTSYISSQLNIHSDSATIDARATFRGSSSDGFPLDDVDVSFRFKLTFNSRGVVNGIEKTSISGSVKGHRNHDASGLTLAKIKKLANETAKRFL